VVSHSLLLSLGHYSIQHLSYARTDAHVAKEMSGISIHAHTTSTVLVLGIKEGVVAVNVTVRHVVTVAPVLRVVVAVVDAVRPVQELILQGMRPCL